MREVATIVVILVLIDVCRAGASSGHALGEVIHACRMLERADEVGLMKVGEGSLAAPSPRPISALALQRLCRPRPFPMPVPVSRDTGKAGWPRAL